MKLIVIIALFIFSNTYGQFSHQFVYAGKVEGDNYRYVAVGPDGTVIGVIWLGATEGIYAFDHSDTSFTNMRHDVLARGRVTVRSDSIVFIENALTLYAYTYDDTSITKISEVADFDNQNNTSVAIGPDGTVFTTTNRGIRAYSFTDLTSFTLLAHRNSIFDNATGIAVGADSIIYVAGGGNGFYAFSFYDDSTFTQLDHINVNQAAGVAVRSDGTIFFTNVNTGGVLAYTFNGTSFDSLAQGPVGGALDLAISADGTIFVANSLDGLRALTFDGTTFTNTAHINVRGSRDVAVGPDGVIYTTVQAAGSSEVGLMAFRYEKVTAVDDEENQVITGFQLSQNYPNPFNPSTIIRFSMPGESFVTIKVFNTLGEEITTLINENIIAGNYEVEFSAKGGSASGGDAWNLPSGIYFYRIQAGFHTN
ncbi:MAG: T9SS type A sorting domain-containing protein [Bacteroidetes bacterium]|nr:T9SS type A sorting domain-containing protein [Bacteroidota bacterium]